MYIVIVLGVYVHLLASSEPTRSVEGNLSLLLSISVCPYIRRRQTNPHIERDAHTDAHARISINGVAEI